jgi:hypothetical protein
MTAHHPKFEVQRGAAKDSLPDSAHIIRYRRPEAPWSVVHMTVPNGADATKVQTMRLEALGYSIIDVTPPFSPVASTPALA